MLNELLHYLGGQIRVRAEGTYPEQVLNDCARLGIPFRDLRREGENAVTFRLTHRDWKFLSSSERRDKASQRQTGESYTLAVVDREGMPYLLHRLSRHPALAISIPIAATALFLGSFFIWDYEITGNDTIPEEQILRALEQNGVGLGSFGLSLDGEDLRNHILPEIPELAWITVNVSGCRAHVEVRERVMPPEMEEKRTPSNVVARCDGLVLSVRALDGVPAVLSGTSVTAGQLLISGAEDMETVGRTRMMAGHGSVMARTWHKLSVAIPLRVPTKRYTGEERTETALILGRHRFPLPIRLEMPSGMAALLQKGRMRTGEDRMPIEGGYDKTTGRIRLHLLGIPLPITVVRERFRFYETEYREIAATEGQRRGEALLIRQIEAAVTGKDRRGEIRGVLCSAQQKGEMLTVTLQAECEEEIGVAVPILTA